jgi:hypothetical protein
MPTYRDVLPPYAERPGRNAAAVIVITSILVMMNIRFIIKHYYETKIIDAGSRKIEENRHRTTTCQRTALANRNLQHKHTAAKNGVLPVY